MSARALVTTHRASRPGLAVSRFVKNPSLPSDMQARAGPSSNGLQRPSVRVSTPHPSVSRGVRGQQEATNAWRGGELPGRGTTVLQGVERRRGSDQSGRSGAAFEGLPAVPDVVEPDWDDEEGNEASSGSQADSAANDGPTAHPDPLGSVPALLRGESNGDVAHKGASQKTPHAASWNQSLAALPSPASQVCA